MIKVGLIGKTNTGKTTFFNSATLLSAEISNYPFTTKRPATGNAIRFQGVTWIRYEAGKMAEGWDCWNFDGLMKQLLS